MAADQSVVVGFTLLNAHGGVVRDATATLAVDGQPAVPLARLDTGDAFRQVGDHYAYVLKLSDQGVTSGSATLTISVSDGTTHSFTLEIRPPHDQHRGAPG